MSDTVFHIGQSAKNIMSTPAYQPYSMVRIIVGEDDDGTQLVYEAGNDSARVMELTNPNGTQAMAEDILARLSGYQYAPYEVDGAIINPAAELGDGVATGDIYSFLSSMETTLSPIMSSNIAAYDDGEMEHEYPYESQQAQEVARKINGLRTSFTAELGRIESDIAETYETKTEAGDMKVSLESKITQTKNSILQTVSETYETISNAGSEYSDLRSEIEQTATGITQTVSQTYETKTAATNKLNQAKGYTDTQTNTLSTNLQSQIRQTANSIKSTVASNETKYDLSALPSGVTIDYYNYGRPQNYYSASENTNKIYLNCGNGFYYKSNGSSWVLQNSTPLPITTDKLESKIEQTASSIALQVSGANAPEWSEDSVEYVEGDIVKVTTESGGIVVGTAFYEAVRDHTSDPNKKPPNSYYWAVADAPTTQSLIDMNLSGITISYDSNQADENNSAYITLTKGEVSVGGLVKMSNIVANELDANCILTDGMSLYGQLTVFAENTSGTWTAWGAIGSANGSDGVNDTQGCMLRSKYRGGAYNYLIATTSGVRMQYLPSGFDSDYDDYKDYPHVWVDASHAGLQFGDYQLYITSSGIYATDGSTTKDLLA